MRSASPDRRLEYLQQHGTDAVSFQALESIVVWWFDDDAQGTGAAVPYVACGGSWIAVGRPLAPAGDRRLVAHRFAAAARAVGKRAVFFGVESLAPFDGFRRLTIGVQSVLPQLRWPTTLKSRRTLREQIRRARAKGVVARVVPADALAAGTPLRADIDRLRREWLDRKHLEPMSFLVSVEPFHAPTEHLYVVAERYGRPVQFLSAVPIYQRHGWLLEDVLRSPDAPNGTTELVIDTVMRTLTNDAAWVTPGLTPLAGKVAWWLRPIRAMTTPLYDFSGLERFRARLSPARWDPVWLVWNRGSAAFVILDVLRAFAHGRLVSFAWRSLIRHPSGPPWAVAMPLVPWTLLLMALAISGHAMLLGWSTGQLAAWVLFDAVLAVLLLRAARRPHARALAALTLTAGGDAVISVAHLASFGLGQSAVSGLLRLVATAGPLIGSTALAWAALRAASKGRLAEGR